MLTGDPAGEKGSGVDGGSRASFALLLAAVVLVFTAPRLLLHELWRDEAWLWIVATGSESLPTLFAELSRSGQGYLFPVLAWGVARLSGSVHAFQLLNLAIVVAGAYTLGRFAPFRRTECVLLVFGYYLGYEYAVLTRHYALGAALVFAACAAIRARRPRLAALALALLCQTTVYGYILAIPLAAGAPWLLQAQQRAGAPALKRRDLIAAMLLLAMGAVAGVVQLMPEPGTAFAVGWHVEWNVARVLETLQIPWRALVPFPRLQLEAWNSDLLAGAPPWRAGAGIAALMMAAFLLWPRRLGVSLFALGAGGLLAFGYLKYLGSMRHHGHLWLLLVAAAWLAGGIGFDTARVSFRRAAWYALLLVHFAAALVVSSIDLLHPFSNGARTAAALRDSGLDGYPLLGYREPPAAPVALALGRALYAPSRERYATHTDWGPQQRDIGIATLRCAAVDLARREDADVILVMNSRLPPWPEAVFVQAIEGAMVPSENFFLYRIGHASIAAGDVGALCAQGKSPP